MKEIIILKNANSRPLSVDSFQRPKMNGRSRAMLASSGGNFFFFLGGGRRFQELRRCQSFLNQKIQERLSSDNRHIKVSLS